MTERIMGKYVVERVNEIVDGVLALTVTAQLDPKEATHFLVPDNYFNDAMNSIYQNLQGRVYVLGTAVGVVEKYDDKFKRYVVEVVPVG